MNESQEIINLPENQITVLRDPTAILNEAKKAAQALMTVVAQKKKPVIMNGEQYLEFEDWMTVGRFYGLTVKIKSTNFINYDQTRGFEATADVVRADGVVVSSAESMCLDDEKNWKEKPLFQLRSMAQTRAAAKAFRNVLAWVVVLGGFRTTPAEEMIGQEFTPTVSRAGKPVVDMPQAKTGNFADRVIKEVLDLKNPKDNNKTNPISEAQNKRLFAIRKGVGWPDEDFQEWLNLHYGIDSSKAIDRINYDIIVQCVQSYKKPAENPIKTPEDIFNEEQSEELWNKE